MGYSTDFSGSLQLSKPATTEQTAYINLLGRTRRMQRDVNKLMALYKGKHGYPFAKDKTNADEVYGFKGEYFAMNDGDCGQKPDDSIIDYNAASGEIAWKEYDGDWNKRDEMIKALNADKIKQPGLWLQWELNDDGTELRWDGSEKFYNYIEWLEYLIVHFFKPWKIKLNGEIYWVGEDSSDRGYIKVVNNKVTIYEGETKYKKRVS
jgi:hypothetical protein